MPTTMRRRLTTTDVIAAGRRMLHSGTPTSPQEIRERMAAIDAAMGCLTGTNYGTDFYVKLGQEWSRLAAVLSGGSSRSLTPAMTTRSTRDEYAAAEAAWQRDPARSELARRHRQIPAHWRLPERPQRKVDIPTIRLDADTAPRVTVNLPRSAFAGIEAECVRSGDLETGGWLSGHQPREWHRDRGILEATVSVRHRSTDSVTLDADEFVRWDAKMRAERRSGGGDFRALGGWHSHPVGDAMPSAGDLDCWAHRLSTMIDPGSSLTTLITARPRPRPRLVAQPSYHGVDHQARQVEFRGADGVRTRNRDHPMTPPCADTVACTRSLLIRGPNGYARFIQEGEHVHRSDAITRTHRDYFQRRRWWHRIRANPDGG